MDNKIYVLTFERKNNSEKFNIMDLAGNILAQPYLPVATKASFTTQSLGRGNRFWCIYKNIFYYLVENENEEAWNLYRVNIQ